MLFETIRYQEIVAAELCYARGSFPKRAHWPRPTPSRRCRQGEVEPPLSTPVGSAASGVEKSPPSRLTRRRRLDTYAMIGA